MRNIEVASSLTLFSLGRDTFNPHDSVSCDISPAQKLIIHYRDIFLNGKNEKFLKKYKDSLLVRFQLVWSPIYYSLQTVLNSMDSPV